MIFALAFSLHIFLGVFFGQGSRPLAWASTPWAICRTDRLSTIDYRLSLRIYYWIAKCVPKKSTHFYFRRPNNFSTAR